MPGMTGVELARRVRPIAPDLPILFASGYADIQTFGSELSEEVLLKKPYRIADLAARIDAVLTARETDNVVPLRR
jgi:CheY-like chemotaxis protein